MNFIQNYVRKQKYSKKGVVQQKLSAF